MFEKQLYIVNNAREFVSDTTTYDSSYDAVFALLQTVESLNNAKWKLLVFEGNADFAERNPELFSKYQKQFENKIERYSNLLDELLEVNFKNYKRVDNTYVSVDFYRDKDNNHILTIRNGFEKL